MGNILSCTCERKENNNLEYQFKRCNEEFESNAVMKNNFDSTYKSNIVKSKFAGNNRLEHIRTNNLVKKIQIIYRIHHKMKKMKKEIDQEKKDLVNLIEENEVKHTKPDYLVTEGKELMSYIHMENGYKYYGKKKDGLREGFGFLNWNDGAQYIGMFSRNQAYGYGKFTRTDGDSYLGEFKDDRICGFGIYKYTNGAVYTGGWLNDFQESLGIEKWQDGSSYKGNYSKGKKSGIGCYYWANGSKYEGEWRDNCLEGFGIYLFSDLRSYVGEWKRNMMHGYGEFNWKSGKKYVGYYSNDRKEGFGIYFWNNHNKAYVGFWLNGRQDGVGKYMTPEKSRYGLWKNGERVKWFVSEQEAFLQLNYKAAKYKELFKYEFCEIDNFLNAKN